MIPIYKVITFTVLQLKHAVFRKSNGSQLQSLKNCKENFNIAREYARWEVIERRLVQKGKSSRYIFPLLKNREACLLHLKVRSCFATAQRACSIFPLQRFKTFYDFEHISNTIHVSNNRRITCAMNIRMLCKTVNSWLVSAMLKLKFLFVRLLNLITSRQNTNGSLIGN